MAPTGDEPTRRAIQESQPSKLDGEEVASMSLWLGRGGFGLAFAQDRGAPAVEPRVQRRPTQSTTMAILSRAGRTSGPFLDTPGSAEGSRFEVGMNQRSRGSR